VKEVKGLEGANGEGAGSGDGDGEIAEMGETCAYLWSHCPVISIAKTAKHSESQVCQAELTRSQQ